MATKSSKGLTTQQAEILTAMAAGAEIRNDWLGSTRLANVGSGKFASRRTVHGLTLDALKARGYVEKTGYRYPDHIFTITDAGREALAAHDAAKAK